MTILPSVATPITIIMQYAYFYKPVLKKNNDRTKVMREIQFRTSTEKFNIFRKSNFVAPRLNISYISGNRTF